MLICYQRQLCLDNDKDTVLRAERKTVELKHPKKEASSSTAGRPLTAPFVLNTVKVGLNSGTIIIWFTEEMTPGFLVVCSSFFILLFVLWAFDRLDKTRLLTDFE